jgi:hypothetical protein
VGVIDPEERGIVSRLARPGGNITGLTSHAADLNGKRLEILREHIGEFLIQQINNRAASLLAKVILRFVQFHCHKESTVSRITCHRLETKVMFDFALSLQPVIQFMTLPPPPGFEELVSTFANEVRNAFDRTATRVRAIVHFRQFQTFGNLTDHT